MEREKALVSFLHNLPTELGLLAQPLGTSVHTHTHLHTFPLKTGTQEIAFKGIL